MWSIILILGISIGIVAIAIKILLWLLSQTEDDYYDKYQREKPITYEPAEHEK